MEDAKICRLEAIELEEDDLDLFPDRVVQAYKDGRHGPMRAYGMLRKHVKSEANAKRKERQLYWLSQRRVWAAGGSSPSQFTFNGIGTRMYGQKDLDLEDGSYLTTLYFVFLFIPFFPISSHWVSPGDGDGLWVHGDVPHPDGVWWPTLIPMGLGAGGMVATLAWVFSLSGSAQVHLHNGFDRAVTVTIEDRPYILPPGTSEEIRLSAEVDLDVTAEFSDLNDGPFETVTLPLASAEHGWMDELVYNIGGRSLLVYEYVYYGSGEPQEPFVLLDQVQFVERVDYPFRMPPEEIRIKGSGEEKTWLHVPDPPFPVVDAMGYLAQQGGTAAALRMGWSELRLGSSDENLIAFVAQLQSPDGQPDPVFCEELLADSDHVNRHRFCQSLAKRSDPEGTLARYTQLAADHPDEAMYQYLLGRMLEGDAALEAQNKALQIDPDYARAHFAIAWQHALHDGDAQVALQHLEKAGPQMRGSDQLLARLMQRAGRPPAQIAEQLALRNEPSAFTLSDMYGLLADPTTYQAELVRISRFDYGEDDIANVHANVALLLGKVDDLRQFNAGGGGLDVFLALSDGATEDDLQTPVFEDPFGIEPRQMLYWWLLEKQRGGNSAAWEPLIEGSVPGLIAQLNQPEGLTPERLATVLSVDVDPSTQVGAWFVAWRLTGDARFARMAREFALPTELPVFAMP